MDSQSFDIWNEEKKKIDFGKSTQFFVNPKEIWYIKLGKNIGSESNGKKDFRRPALIIKKIGSMFFVAPMTTKGKENKFYHTIENAHYVAAHGQPEISRIQLSQVRIIDKKRCIHKLGEVKREEFEEIIEKLSKLLL